MFDFLLGKNWFDGFWWENSANCKQHYKVLPNNKTSLALSSLQIIKNQSYKNSFWSSRDIFITLFELNRGEILLNKTRMLIQAWFGDWSNVATLGIVMKKLAVNLSPFVSGVSFLLHYSLKYFVELARHKELSEIFND